MKKALKRITSDIYYYNGTRKIMGAHKNIRGDVTGIIGNVTEIRGNVSGIFGDVTGIRGNVLECEITEEERKAGISIDTLMQD